MCRHGVDGSNMHGPRQVCPHDRTNIACWSDTGDVGIYDISAQLEAVEQNVGGVQPLALGGGKVGGGDHSPRFALTAPCIASGVAPARAISGSSKSMAPKAMAWIGPASCP